MGPWGTKMSPFAGGRSRLMTRLVKRWLNAISTPRSGFTSTSIPAQDATRPTHDPAALTTWSQPIESTAPVRVSHTVTPTTRSPARSIPVASV